MKKNKLAKALDLVDDDLLEEAMPRVKKVKKRSVWRMAMVACLGALLVACSLWLFIPFNTDPPNVSQYEDSEYYDIILKLNAVTFVRPAFKNNFDKYVLNIFRGATAEDGSPMEATGTNTVTLYSSNYEETTDNQVQGVIEADRIKRSTTHIYYLNNDSLTVYTVAGEDSALVGSYLIPIHGNTRITSYYDEWELYLSKDCKTVTVIAPYYEYGTRGGYVDIVSLDVTDPAAIKEQGRISVSGAYLSSRMVDGEMLLMTQFRVNSNPDFSEEKSFLPQINTGNGFESLPVGDIISPATLNAPRYTVVCKLSKNGLVMQDSAAFLSYSTEVYVSAEEIFATRSYSESFQKDGNTYDRAMTEISRMAYGGDTLEYKGSICVNGTVKNQYSMDVYEGVLRVVTTTRESLLSVSRDGETQMLDRDTGNDTSADLYCISLAEWRVIAQVVGFAPKGETVESVRFEGDHAYVCTAVVVTVTDPVFFFDLSDLSHITYKDTGEITGYSTSLVDFGDGYLLGVGVGDGFGTLKIEIYEESATGVVSVCKYELENVSYSEQYKSYYIDRENRLIGLGVSYWGKSEADSYNGYVVLHFDGFALREVLKEKLNGTNEGKRGLLIDGYFYLFGMNDFTVKPFV